MGELPLTRANLLSLAEELELSLYEHILSKWYPAAILPAGGFLQDFDQQWQAAEVQSPPSVVYHSRLTYTASLAAQNGLDGMRSFAQHGARSLKNSFWDAEKGGFYWNLGDPLKHVYGISFAIYALATAHAALGDRADVELANTAFLWLEEHAHDKEQGGYFEVLDAKGTPLHDSSLGRPVTGPAAKSMNSHIHLLEAFSALYSVLPSELLEKRLREVLAIVTKRVFNGKGLNMFFSASWEPLSHADSYGHDIETAYLLIEALESLRIEDDDVQRTAKALVDHTLDVAWDSKLGGIYDEGTLEIPERRVKVWWSQAESLNALLLMHEIYGAEDSRYSKAFLAQWQFIRAHQIDAEWGGWHAEIDADGTILPWPKSNPWLDPYHQGRALITVIRRLRDLAEHAP